MHEQTAEDGCDEDQKGSSNRAVAVLASGTSTVVVVGRAWRHRDPSAHPLHVGAFAKRHGQQHYAAAVKSGSVSWKAFSLGSLDPGSFITVDKLPASLWIQELSARIFGFSRLEHAGAAGAPRGRRRDGAVPSGPPVAGDIADILAGLALALTPVAVVIFRYNQPDALLTLLLVLATSVLSSALEKGADWKAAMWRLAGCGALVGFAFLTKMMEAAWYFLRSRWPTLSSPSRCGGNASWGWSPAPPPL